ncbi:titin homolog [Prunus yedoensis var. nudiflora]|uniref:Titin homolog n=1 Tax=Prunus yedoensis var. nudiflora TaxID=2094558 RepID=A0A314ZWF0_PRUYE|nr:titin homolog [Prunus yedoensis var. nudiflora]
MAFDYSFTADEMAIDDGLGYPKAYAKLCRDRSAGPYSHGPPFTFMPYCLQQQEDLRARDLEQMFPIIDPKAKPTTRPKIFVSLLWKQLNHLGNAGFDPAVIRVDPYGNVLYYHADSASPLAWDIDHWFPCSRGGLTVPSNLRILQWQACKKKHNMLEFLIPWWDFQLGISVNQFLSIFASSNSDFRHRAFSFLFSEGENEELNSSQNVDSHSFPQHYMESKEYMGLAPAAIVVSRRESYGSSSVLKSLDYNKQIQPYSPAIAARKGKHIVSNENENPNFITNPYQAIVMARDSLKQREQTAKMQGEIQNLDDEVNELRQKNEEEKLTIQNLELTLIKRRRRAEKCRRLAEAQSSYRTMLEKMIRDAMHQSVIYKEQLRLNQAASSALMARLEAQKAICDASEKELHKKYKQRDELETQIRPEWEQARKRSRMDDALAEERESKTVLYLPESKPRTVLHKELRVFLEEEQKASNAALSQSDKDRQIEVNEELERPTKRLSTDKLEEKARYIDALEDENLIENKMRTLEIEERNHKFQFPVLREPDIEEDEESRKQRGKGNVEKWLQILLDSSPEELGPQNENESEIDKTGDIIRKMNLKYPQEVKNLKRPEAVVKKGVPVNESIVQEKDGNAHKLGSPVGGVVSRKSFEGKERRDQSNGKERKLARSESARAFRRIPSSPSIILGMKKGVDCIRKKPMVTSDDEESYATENNFIKSSMKTIKKAVKL